jgi:transposase
MGGGCVFAVRGNRRAQESGRGVCAAGAAATDAQFRDDDGAPRELQGWLVSPEAPQAAMESTGAYWKPIFSLLEESGVGWFIAAHVKSVPGWKTDVNDAQRLADSLQHGLLRGGERSGRLGDTLTWAPG